jgi:hypothetical protein
MSVVTNKIIGFIIHFKTIRYLKRGYVYFGNVLGVVFSIPRAHYHS